MSIAEHIANKEAEKNGLIDLLDSIVELDKVVGLSELTMNEIRAKISSRIAQCEISIRDHKKLIKQ